MTYHIKGVVVGHKNITKFGLSKLYHAPDHGSKSYIWVFDFENFCIYDVYLDTIAGFLVLI